MCTAHCCMYLCRLAKPAQCESAGFLVQRHKMTDTEVMQRATSVAKVLIDHLPAPTHPTPLTGVEQKTGDISERCRGVSPIPGWEGLYSINEYGEIHSHGLRKVQLKPWIRKGYHIVQLYNRDKYKNYKVHRLVAITYIPNPYNKPAINHIDGDKSNNHVSNLEWVTYKENTDHAKANGLMWYQKRSKA